MSAVQSEHILDQGTWVYNRDRTAYTLGGLVHAESNGKFRCAV
jgi:hypothetical protein